MAELKVEMWPIERCIPYCRNPRKNDEQVDRMASAIKEFGFRIPIVAKSDGSVVDGHLRLKAAQKLGLTEVPVALADELTEAQVKAFRILANKSANWAEWEPDLLKLELEDLQEMDFDLELTGFELPELDEILGAGADGGTEGQTDPDAVPEAQEEPVSRLGDVWLLGRHRLMCGDSTDAGSVALLMNGSNADLLLTDPPYNVSYEGGTKDRLTILNDSMDDEKFRSFLADAFKAADTVMKNGAAFYIWHADIEGYNFRGAVRDTGWMVRQCLIWVKNSMVLGRQDYQWKHEPCQPAGTKVLTVDGLKNIEDLTEQDRVISYSSCQGQVVGFKNGGYAIQTANRHYKGTLYGIEAAGKKTWCTNNHQFSVRFNSMVKKNYCTYLMKRGDWWRVGITKAYDARQFGLKTRLHQEKGEAVWLIGIYEDKIAAQVAEQILSVKYGIPYTIWEQDRFSVVHRSQDQISAIYAALDLKLMNQNAIRLLHDFNRDENYPLITKENQNEKFSTRVTAKINACNLVPGLMQVPIPNENPGSYPNFKWAEISDIDHKEHDGLVYSLAVEKYEHYVADGIITHNCLYGWKDGAAHLWTSDRRQTTVLEFNKPNRNGEHPTMKPVELFEYQMLNSTNREAVVLDLFGGSGTTMIAAEKNGRSARLMELDPRYCDVIVRRWQDFTGQEATLEDGGRTFARVKEERGG